MPNTKIRKRPRSLGSTVQVVGAEPVHRMPGGTAAAGGEQAAEGLRSAIAAVGEAQGRQEAPDERLAVAEAVKRPELGPGEGKRACFQLPGPESRGSASRAQGEPWRWRRGAGRGGGRRGGRKFNVAGSVRGEPVEP